LKSLQYMFLNGNRISNIGALSGLTSLQYVLLNDNQITDVYPLVLNTGISSGDTVILYNNPLNTDSINLYIPQLQERGVTVGY
jgi:Leucine-rich repeat (LRR) protein